jgi:hypothetical protein
LFLSYAASGRKSTENGRQRPGATGAFLFFWGKVTEMERVGWAVHKKITIYLLTNGPIRFTIISSAGDRLFTVTILG